MDIKDFTNDNFIILKTLYDNQVTVLNEKQIPVSQIELAEALGFSKNKMYSVFKMLQEKGYVEAISKGKYRLTDRAVVIVETIAKLNTTINQVKENN